MGENLKRDDLDALDRAEQLTQWKVIYEKLHQETKHGGAPGAGRGKAPRVAGPATLRFTKDATKKSGKSKSTIERAIKVAADLGDKMLASSLAAAVPASGCGAGWPPWSWSPDPAW